MAYDPTNIFAKILRGELPAIRIYEDAQTLAFMDIMPQADGHVLVIPKEPARDILDLSSDGAMALIKTSQRIARAVKSALAPPGLMLVQLNGAAAGQTVFHIHVHIIPRDAGLELALHARKMEDMAKLNAIAEKIRAALD